MGNMAEKKQNRIACCFMTHNHPAVVEDVLAHAQESYAAHGIDMIFCDDSSDGRTREIVEKYIENGADNVYYADTSGVENGTEKYIRTVKKEYLPHEYDFLWPCKDRVYFRGEILDTLVSSCELGFDLIMMLNPGDRLELDWPQPKNVYTDPVEFFHHFGQLTTNWEGIVYNVSTMLENADWDALERRYRLNPQNDFVQPVTIFCRLAEIEQCKIRIIYAQQDQLIYSDFARSEWRHVIFEVWIDKWIPAIFSLPSIYDPYKAFIVKCETNLWALFGGMDSLVGLRGEGLLTKEVFERYRGMWSGISDVPVEYIDMMLNDQYTDMFTKIFDDFMQAFAMRDLDKAFMIYVGNQWMKEVIGEEEFNELCNAFSHYRFLRINHLSTDCYKTVTNKEQFLEIYHKVHV